MKLLARLREPHTTATTLGHFLQTSWETLPEWKDASQDYVTETAVDHEDDHLGIGAAMLQDVAGFDLMDSCRRKIPELHEFPPHGIPSSEIGFAEQEY